MSRLRFYAMRSVKTVFILWFILTMLFFGFRLMPGDFTDYLVYSGASEEAARAIAEQWGLHKPLYIQYWDYLTKFVTLDAGTSVQAREPVWDFVKLKLFNTLILAIPAITLAYVVAGILGSYIGDKRGTRIEKAVITGVTFIGAFPGFFIGIVFIIVFAVWLDLFPTGGMVGSETVRTYQHAAWWRIYFTKSFAWHYLLPFLTIVARATFSPTLLMRTSFVEIKGLDFVHYQKVTGLPYTRRLRHLSKHAILPLITLYPISLLQTVSGLVLIEFVFNWPGIGWTLVQAITFRDVPVVMFVFFLAAATVVIANFVVDILYGVIDPRISVEEH